MSDEKTYTERDIVLAKREGWVRHCVALCGNREDAEKYAAREFPLPRVTRPRVVVGPSPRTWNWKFEAGAYWFRATGHGSWERANPSWEPDPELVTLWADLLANPTEEVEE